MENIAVIFGGKSVEHDVSILTGIGIIKNLSDRYNVVPIYIDKKGKWWTSENFKDGKTFFNKGARYECYISNFEPTLKIKKGFRERTEKIDCAILAVHGGVYEGGAVQAVLELADIPYTSPDIMGSSLCMDKITCKQLLKSAGILTVESKSIDEDLNFPVIVKPARAGSSIGVSKVLKAENLSGAIIDAKLFDNKVLIEECLEDFRELNVSVMRVLGEIKVSCIEEITVGACVFDFEDKYIKDNIKRIVPAKLDEKVQIKIEDIAKRVYEVLDLKGIIRIDLFLKDEDVYVNEINTIPGSLSFYLWKDKGYSFMQMLKLLIEESKREKSLKNGIHYEYESNVLDNLGKIDRIRVK